MSKKKIVGLFLLVAWILGAMSCVYAQNPVLTQDSAVSKEKYLKVKAYREFLKYAEKRYLIPGLNQAVIPQGMDYCAEQDKLYISGYYKIPGVSSVLMVINANDGEFLADYHLYWEDGSPCTSHVGGVAVVEDRIYLSAGLDGDSEYLLAVIPMSSLTEEGSHDLIIKDLVSVPVSPSFLNCSNEMLWVGNFYYPSAGYVLSPDLEFTTPTASGDYGCYILGYSVKRLQSMNAFSVPDCILVAPDRIQGMTMDSTGKVYLSQSYGRKNDSTIFQYQIDLDAPKSAINIRDISVPAWYLDKESVCSSMTVMPMTEALCQNVNGEILVLFESGAMAYKDGKNRTDYIWRLEME